MSYTARGGWYWDKSSCITSSRGQFSLHPDSSLDKGEPIQKDDSGLIGQSDGSVFKKFKVKSYELTAGSGQVLGVGIRDIESVGGETDSYRASHAKNLLSQNRDIIIVHRGAVMVKNVGSKTIDIMDTVIPADGGCEKCTATNQYTLGKAMNIIPPGKWGLIWVDPDYETEIL